MHVWTHLKEESQGVTGQGIYADGMVEHDAMVGQLLAKLDEMGIADNTIVMYSTDNGAETLSWPDGGTTPFKGEKNTTWEGGFRVPTMVRWPGKFEAGQVSNEIISHQDWIPTLLSAAGNDSVKEDLLKGRRVNGRKVKVHLDGYNFLPYFKGEEEKGPRKDFFYFTDDGSVSALRYNDWKINFTVQDAHGVDVWSNPYRELRLPLMQQLRMDPFEKAQHEAMSYGKWGFEHLFVLVPAQVITRNFLQTFQAFPPRQKPGSFSLDRVLEELEQGQPK
jgi:arylsulfatase A-like enzyme